MKESNESTQKKEGGTASPVSEAEAPPVSEGTGAGSPEGKGKRKLQPRTAAIVGAVALAVVLIVVLIYRSWARRPDLPVAENPQPSESQAEPGQEEPPDLEEPEQFDGEKPYVSGARKKDFYTFLIVGRGTIDGGNTDTIILASYDVVNQQAAMMSIPRDTMVNASWDVKKINTVYNVNEAHEAGSGTAALKRYVAGLTGFEPDFTVMVEWEAVGEIVDAIGGVYFDVPFYMHYSDPSQDLYIDQPEGYRLLNGEDAMQVVRWRKNNGGVSRPAGYDNSDLGRTGIQRSFLAAVIKQCLQIKNVTKLTELAEIFTQRVETELTVGNLVWFAEQALLGGFSTEEMYTCSMPIAGGYDIYCRTAHREQNFVVPKANELIEIINAHFNPYEEQVALANLDIMSVNADGTIASSTGVVRDQKMNEAILSRQSGRAASSQATGVPAPSSTDSPGGEGQPEESTGSGETEP